MACHVKRDDSSVEEAQSKHPGGRPFALIAMAVLTLPAAASLIGEVPPELRAKTWQLFAASMCVGAVVSLFAFFGRKSENKALAIAPWSVGVFGYSIYVWANTTSLRTLIAVVGVAEGFIVVAIPAVYLISRRGRKSVTDATREQADVKREHW